MDSLFYDYRDLRLSIANIDEPFILTKSPQPLSNRFIEGIGSNLNDVVYTLKISATHDVRANPNLTCIMIGERVADWMRAED